MGIVIHQMAPLCFPAVIQINCDVMRCFQKELYYIWITIFWR